MTSSRVPASPNTALCLSTTYAVLLALFAKSSRYETHEAYILPTHFTIESLEEADDVVVLEMMTEVVASFLPQQGIPS